MRVLMNSSFDAMTMASFLSCLFAASSASCNSFWCATAALFSSETFSSSAWSRSKRAVSTAANDCRARGDALRAQLEATTEERDEYQNSVIKLEQQLKEAKDERDAATKAAGVIQAKLDAANEDIEKNQVILEEKDVFIKTLIQTPKGK